MRKALVGVSLGCLLAGGAHARSLVVNGGPCGVYDINRQHVDAIGHYTVTNFDDGTSLVVCHAQVDNPTGAMVRYDFDNTGVTCGAGRNGTITWQEIIAPSGQVTLTCILRKGQ